MDKSIEKAKAVLCDYLSQYKMRKTIERFRILDYVYAINGHFTIEELASRIDEDEDKFYVSKATLYNTMQLFVTCHIVEKHPLMDGVIHYEKSLTMHNTNKCVCVVCGKEREFKDAALTKYINEKESKRFHILCHSVFLYGLCFNCQQRKKREEINLNHKEKK